MQPESAAKVQGGGVLKGWPRPPPSMGTTAAWPWPHPQLGQEATAASSPYQFWVLGRSSSVSVELSQAVVAGGSQMQGWELPQHGGDTAEGARGGPAGTWELLGMVRCRELATCPPRCCRSQCPLRPPSSRCPPRPGPCPAPGRPRGGCRRSR